MISPARWAAFEALRLADTSKGGGKDLASALAGTRKMIEDSRDRALATELALGVERWRAALDAIISASSGRRISTIDFPALLSLRLAVFQMKFLTRTPAHAVVDDAVEITRQAGASRAAGFVNGVLRGLQRTGFEAGLPSRPGDDNAGEWTRYIATSLSHPEWLVARMIDRYGPQAAEAWALFNNAPAPLTLRVNTRRLTVDEAQAHLAADGVAAVPAPRAPHALIVTEGNPIASPLHDDGSIALMDETSQLVGALGASLLSGTVLDACAAPGGKTLVLSCDLPPGSRLVAADRRPRRVALLRRALARYGLADVPVVQHDLSQGVPFTGLDGIFVDAPCSGLGTIRRDPDIRWRRAETDLAALSGAQAAMLHEAALAVRAGGRIVYSTCSSEPEENEGVVDAFLAAHPEFCRTAIEGARFAPFVDATGDFRTLPQRDRLESFFAAILQRS
ncbi:MAG: hypothetical protein M3Q55_00280 [Acidobacteriota bacterium]|nr:hypothetical protein [Acidobacteriota bacterium]